MIFCQDKRTIYFDTDERLAYEQIILLIDENQRLGITPVTSFYFVEDTAILWRYDNDNGWRQLTAPPSEQIVFLNRAEFPPIGKDKVLYVSENAIYRWQNGEYTDISSIQWGGIFKLLNKKKGETNMSIVSGFEKIKDRILTSAGYKLRSLWTSAQTVEMDDGTMLQDKIESMDTALGYLDGAKSNIQSQINTLNSNLSELNGKMLPKNIMMTNNIMENADNQANGTIEFYFLSGPSHVSLAPLVNNYKYSTAIVTIRTGASKRIILFPEGSQYKPVVRSKTTQNDPWSDWRYFDGTDVQ